MMDIDDTTTAPQVKGSLMIGTYVAPTTGAEAVFTFLAHPLSGELEDVPGIGKKAKALLAEDSEKFEFKPIHNSYQLLGKFLSFKEVGMTGDQHNNQFYLWLHEKGIKSHVSHIVQGIAAKANHMMLNSHLGSPIQQVKDSGWKEVGHAHPHMKGATEVGIHGTTASSSISNAHI